MKQLIALTILVYANCLHAQNAPYAGGTGSGAAANSTPATACSLFFGGTGSGATANTTPATVCPPFFGGTGSGSDLQSGGCTTILPVTLLSFTGEKQASGNLLRWQVTDVTQVGHFVIERSNDGLHYTQLAQLAGTGSPSYSYLDVMPLAEKNFYRLLMIDADGESRYSHVVVLRNASAGKMLVYPNPAGSSATVYVHSDEKINTAISIYQSDGKLVSKTSVRLVQGPNQVSLDLKRLTNGVYFIRFDDTQNAFRANCTLVINR